MKLNQRKKLIQRKIKRYLNFLFLIKIIKSKEILEINEAFDN